MKYMTDKNIRIFSWSVLVAFIIINYIYLILTSVNIPIWDEWESVFFIDNASISKMFAYHNEHRGFFSKLTHLLLYKINGLNWYSHRIISFSIYILMIGMLYFIVQKRAKDIAYLPLFFIPFFTRLVSENITQDQLGIHLTIIFTLFAIYFGFIKSTNIKNIIITAIFLFCSAISFSFALPFGIIVAYLMKEIINIYFLNKDKKYYEVIRLILTIILFLFTLLIPFYFLGKPPIAPWGIALPTTLKFWSFFIISYAYVTLPISINFIVSLLTAIFVSIPVILLLFDKVRLQERSFQAYYAIILGTCSSISAIAMGRINSGAIEPRHHEILIIIIPIIAVLFIELYRKYKSKSTKILAIVYCFLLFVAMLDKLQFNNYFDTQHIRIQYGTLCVKDYYLGLNDGNCPHIFPAPIPQYFDKAKELNMSFTR